MDRVGGYAGYVALQENARAYDDVLTVMAGEADAQRLAEMQRKASGRGL